MATQDAEASASTSDDSRRLRELSYAPDCYRDCMIKYPTYRASPVRDLPRRDSSCGTLESLSIELLHDALSQLDFRSLANLRRVSFRAKELVEALPAYQHMAGHALHTLRALGGTRLISYFPASLLYDTLRTDRCIDCNDFGPYLFLPTCERCCFNCLNDEVGMRVISEPAAIRSFDIGKKNLAEVPLMLSLPSEYGFEGKRQRDRRWLMSVKEVRELALKIHRIESIMNARVEAKTEKLQAKYEDKFNAWRRRYFKGYDDRRPRRVFTPEETLRHPDDPNRFMASTPFPSYDQRTGKVESGLWCRACNKDKSWIENNGSLDGHPNPEVQDSELEKNRQRAYTEKEILAHFRVCPGAKLLWSSAST